jgi:hypothetical protein
MDIALVLDKIRPGAAWRMCDTYENLVATWEDPVQICPTLEELETAWVIIQQDQQLDRINADYSERLSKLAYAYVKPELMIDDPVKIAERKASKKLEYRAVAAELLMKQEEIKNA